MVFKLFEDIYLMINNKVIWYRLKKEYECKIISEIFILKIFLGRFE